MPAPISLGKKTVHKIGDVRRIRFILFIPSEEKLSAVLERAQTLADSASPAARPGTASRDHPSL